VLAQLAPGATPNAAQSGIRQEGPYLTAPVVLDGATLFRIAAPASPQPGQTPIAARQLAVENALAALVAVSGSGAQARTLYNPRTLAVFVVPSSNGQAVVEAGDGTHAAVHIVTATPIDAKYYGLTITSVADRWRSILQTALRNALFKRQPGIERHHLMEVIIAAAVLLALTFLILAFAILPIQRRLHAIENRLARSAAQAPVGTEPQRRRRFMALALRASDPQRKVDMMHAIAAMLVWVLAVLWFAAFVWGFSLFPQTTPIAHQVLQTVLTVVATWICAGLINRLLDLSIVRIARLFAHRHHLSEEERARELLRIPTFTRAVTGFKTALIFFVALLVTLSEIGIPVWSVVTFGGLAAIGITLAAQNFVRDFVNGFLVLFEDQYVVGDYITINAQSGIVENLTLRVAQIRDTAGNLVTIPHSSVTSVINHSRNWSRVDYRVSIDPSADAAKALELVRRTIESIAQDEQWRGFVLEPLEWIGVDSLSRDGIIIRASMKTAPLRQFELRRAINECVRQAFARAGIAFGAPVPEPLS
jgi:small-conductance mechanosensitive channel